jgi:hypothetical protein
MGARSRPRDSAAGSAIVRCGRASAHGLRKAGATIAAENGATERQLMAMYDWTSPQEATRYTEAASRKRLAGDGMKLLGGGS